MKHLRGGMNASAKGLNGGEADVWRIGPAEQAKSYFARGQGGCLG